MKNIREIVMAIGGSAAVAKFLKRPQPTICSWMARDRVPFKYWKALVDLAHRRKVKGITIDMLWDMHT
jgi:hypothetical protein